VLVIAGDDLSVDDQVPVTVDSCLVGVSQVRVLVNIVVMTM
jgi:hypothetical protein